MARAERLDAIQRITEAFDRHDLDAIMADLTDDAVYEAPRGPERWGRRVEGAVAIREAFAARFGGIPDVRYREGVHFVDGDRGASEWRLTGTTTDGRHLDLHGCDLWTFSGDRVVKKDSFWKLVEP